MSIPKPANLTEEPPTLPAGHRLLRFDDIDAPELTHSLIRYPAKFHPPVAHALVRKFTNKNQLILDPFCGSGTLMVAAAAEHRNVIGSDIDPVAVFATRAKTYRWRPGHLRSSWCKVESRLQHAQRSENEYQERQFCDLTVQQFESSLQEESLWVPEIPNLFHWFRRYVVVDLARIVSAIESLQIPETHRLFFRLALASIIRKSSNADPVPVSGLEVTSHMRRLDARGRPINPFAYFTHAVRAGLIAAESYYDLVPREQSVTVLRADARTIGNRLRRHGGVDCIITSPPYHNAVDYYRRHQLEMYWLGLTRTHQDRLELQRDYIGRQQVRIDAIAPDCVDELGPLSMEWYKTMYIHSPQRARAFLHYITSLRSSLGQFEKLLHAEGHLVFVLGNSQWKGKTLATCDLVHEIVPRGLSLKDRYWYPIRNRHMSYGRHNGANIGEEFVLAFERVRDR